ncbi:Gfo/Idh/MocA family oxidoreductase, partial [Peribacillus frigoritolerans]|uniref:Gfo/Idh/MocA family protein n=1 Tax=Peribacillus frigoritolerans TaxID=450367 RepID=UPI002E23F395|nr:Gfo/Idh/MocA family oxidoreductase [Peribacillus frigoritolerans]
LGCGQISQAAHFESARRAKNTNLYAICDVDEYLLDRMNQLHQPQKTYNDYNEMLADPNIDAVIIGIADQFHVAAAKKAILAGKHVLVEKPLGVNIEECLELKEIADKTDLKIQVGSMKRYDPGIKYAQEFIKEEMGEIIGLKAWYCDSTYRYTVTDNIQPIIIPGKNVKRPSGNPKENKLRYYMIGHGSHLVDTARFLGGEIVSVKAWNTQKFGAYCWFITVEYASGYVGQLDLTVAVRMDWHEGFQIYGEHGSVVAKTYNPWLYKSSDVEVFKTSDNSYHRPIGDDAHVYKLQLEGFADSILKGEKGIGADLYDGIMAMKIMKAIAVSVETGETVRVADIKEGAM